MIEINVTHPSGCSTGGEEEEEKGMRRRLVVLKSARVHRGHVDRRPGLLACANSFVMHFLRQETPLSGRGYAFWELKAKLCKCLDSKQADKKM